MQDRHVVLAVAEQHRLSPSAYQRLRSLAGLDTEPAALAFRLSRAMGMAGAVLLGLGLVFWVAANWDGLTRSARFAVLEAAFVLALAAAMLPGVARAGASLLALAGIGGLFAYFGQTYQTGADPWQLFALWAALGLPLCWHARSDWVWAPWAVIAGMAIQLWLLERAGYRWETTAARLGVDLCAWLMHGLTIAILAPRYAGRSGAGPWSFNLSVLFAILVLIASGATAVWSARIQPHFFLALLILAGIVWFSRCRQVFAMCAGLLAIDILLCTGLSRLLLKDLQGEPVVPLFLLAGFAALLLALSVGFAMRNLPAKEQA